MESDFTPTPHQPPGDEPGEGVPAQAGRAAAVPAQVAAADAALVTAVERLIAADVDAARVAAVRLRAIDDVRAASLAADAERARWCDAQRSTLDADALSDPIPRATRALEVSERSACAEIGVALRMSEAGASALVDAARVMIDRHPEVIEALSTGAIRERHALRLVRTVAELPVESATVVVEEALPHADTDFSAFARRVDRLVRRHAPETPEQAHERAREERTVWVTADRDEMAVLSVLLPAVDAHTIHDRLTSIAITLQRDPEESRSRGQLRADALRDLLLDGETGLLPEAVRGIRPTVHITVPALTLATGDSRYGEVEVDGVGPINHQTAARLVGAASEWTRVLTHPVSGIVLSVDRTRYRPPASLARLVRWMHGTCTFPGCRTPAHRCELDHVIDWKRGGATGICNLHPMCTGHHTIKHATRWRVAREPDGTIQWRSPGGQSVRREPRHPIALPDDAPF